MLGLEAFREWIGGVYSKASGRTYDILSTVQLLG